LNQTTRQRLVGTAVLLIVAIILLPVLLDGGGTHQQDIERRVPVSPQTPEVPTVTPQRPVITADSDDILVDDSARRIQPVPSPVAITDPARSSDDADAAPAETDSAEESAPVAAAVPEAPRLDSSGLPEAWSVQLGAFSNQNNVRTLVDRLQAAGHPAYTRPISSAQGQLTGVYVGPKVDRSTALALQSELAETFELTGRVVRYEIEEQ